METFSLANLNTYFKSKEDLRVFLEKQKKVVLPISTERGVTTEWLLKVATGQVLTISKDCYKHVREKLQKHYTREELNHFLGQLTDKGTGFTTPDLPPKEWLVDCIFSLDSNHVIFESPEVEVLRQFPKE